MKMSHVAPPKLLHLCIVMPMRAIIAKILSLKGTYKRKSSSVSLRCQSLAMIWSELQAHPTLWWDFEVNTFLWYILLKKLHGAFDDMFAPLVSLFPCILNCCISDMRLNYPSSLKVLPYIIKRWIFMYNIFLETMLSSYVGCVPSGIITWRILAARFLLTPVINQTEVTQSEVSRLYKKIGALWEASAMASMKLCLS